LHGVFKLGLSINEVPMAAPPQALPPSSSRQVRRDRDILSDAVGVPAGAALIVGTTAIFIGASGGIVALAALAGGATGVLLLRAAEGNRRLHG